MNFPFTTLSAVNTSTGAANAGAVPVLNSTGVLDPTLMNGTMTSTGASNRGETPILNANGFLDPSLFQGISSTDGLADNAGKVPLTNANGVLDASFLAALIAGGGANNYLEIGGWVIQVGTGTMPVPGSGVYVSVLTVTFPKPMSSCQVAIPVATSASGVNPGQGLPVWATSNYSGTGVTFTMGNNISTSPVSVATPMAYVAIGKA